MVKDINKIFIVVTTVFFGLVIGSCKKGENDPALTLRTRKDRIAGEWRIKSGLISIDLIDKKNNVRLNLLYRLSASGFDLTETNDQYYNNFKGGYSLNLKVEKDGNFTIREQYGSQALEGAGIWLFALKSDETKNKEEVEFLLEEVTKGSTTHMHLFPWASTRMRFRIKELRSKKMVLSVNALLLGNPNGMNANISGEYELMQ